MDKEIGILLTSHGDFGHGIIDTASMIIGELEDVVVVKYDGKEDIDLFEENIKNILLRDTDKEWIVFADILGGTPFNASMRVSHGKENILVAYGINIPIFIQTYLSKSTVENASELKAVIEDMQEDAFGFIKLED